MITDWEAQTQRFFDSNDHTVAYEFYLTTQHGGKDSDDAFLAWVDSALFRSEFSRWSEGNA